MISKSHIITHKKIQIEDVIPILQQTKEYLLVQPMIQPVYELHIIRIGELSCAVFLFNSI